jgi:AraC-like DNA-binding protein
MRYEPTTLGAKFAKGPVTIRVNGALKSSHRAIQEAKGPISGLSFKGLDLSVTIADVPGGQPQGNSALQTSGRSGPGLVLSEALAAECAEDVIVRNLFEALASTNQSHHQHAALQADALRLAIAIRLLGLRSADKVTEDRGELAADPCDRQVRSLQKWRLKRVTEYIDAHMSGHITLSHLASVAGLSRMHFASQFRMATGLRPHEFLLRRRIQRAEELLFHSPMQIIQIALAVGFQSQAHFTTVFKRFTSCTPHQWRNAHHSACQASLASSTAERTLLTPIKRG